MSHYAIELKYNFHPEDPDGEITEYFLPYTVEDLLLFDFDNYVKRALMKLKHATDYPLDSYVATKQIDCSHIIELNDTQAENIRAEQVKELDDNDDSCCFSHWEFLSEANLMFKSYLYHTEKPDFLEPLATATTFSQFELSILKVELSLWLHLEHEELVETSTFLKYTESFIHDLPELIRFCGTHSQNHTSDKLSSQELDRLEEWIDNLPSHNRETHKLQKYIQEIIELGRSTNYGIADSSIERYHQTLLHTLCNRVLREIWKVFDHAHYYHELISAISQNKKTFRRKKDHHALRIFLFDNAIQHTPFQMTTYRIAHNIAQFQLHTKEICSNTLTYTPLWDNLKNYFCFQAINIKKMKHYSNKDKYSNGCFALLITRGSENTHYFSVSGTTEELNLYESISKQLRARGNINYDGIGNFAKQIKYIMEHILNMSSVGNILEKKDNQFNFAYLYPELEVRRYTEILEYGHEYSHPYPYLDNTSEIYPNDSSTISKTDCGVTYACCERKMLAHSGYDNAVEIYSRWAPCWKCWPAILDAKGVKVYAFTTSDDYVNTLEAAEDVTKLFTTLKQYEPARIMSYSLTES